MYGTKSGDTFFISGFIQGQGASSDGMFTSTDVRDFGVYPAAVGKLTGSYVAGASLTGTLSGANGSSSFSGKPVVASEFDFAAAPTISTIAGNWSMDVLNGSAASISISSTGAFSGATTEQCPFSGTIAPHSSGKNVFDVRATFGGAPCAIPNQSATGIAVSYLVDGGPLRQLIMLGVNGSRTDGAALIGSR